MTQTMTGGCLCGAKRFTAEVGEEKAYLCHCRMCQRACGNVSLAMVVLPTATIRWEGEPNWYRSSAIAERPFCATCGTSLGFRYIDSPEKMDLTVASFDDPGFFTPHYQFGAESIHRAWLNTEGLPETRSDEYPALQERWAKAEG
ncbi:GFA family protein [Sphingomonas glaciei]|uniref:GFA family protein n=1 Tax=Sphingomonas glaciei TaxID=2938948 RepID=A0ABY5MW89_9SPHN|nr:GFA family protein [Sphingomonas glaciei]UUR08725.1 GFA family protein [Sphingomonas glaciei]